MSETAVAVIELEETLLMVGGLRLDPVAQAGEPQRSGQGVFREYGRQVALDVCGGEGVGLILRLARVAGVRRSALLFCLRTEHEADLARLQRLIKKTSARLTAWSAVPLDHKRLESELDLGEGRQATRLVKPEVRLAALNQEVMAVTRLEANGEQWSALFSMDDFLVDIGLFALDIDDVQGRIQQVRAASTVLGRREPQKEAQFHANADLAGLCLALGSTLGSAITVTGPDAHGTPIRVLPYANAVAVTVAPREAWRVSSGEIGSEVLPFFILDYADQSHAIQTLEPDVRAAFGLIEELAFTLDSMGRARTQGGDAVDLAAAMNRRLDLFEQRFSCQVGELRETIEAANINVDLALVSVRRILEKIVSAVYRKEAAGGKKSKPLFNMIEELANRHVIPPQVVNHMNFVRIFGNVGAHPSTHQEMAVGIRDLNVILEGLLVVVEWYFQYSDGDMNW